MYLSVDILKKYNIKHMFYYRIHLMSSSVMSEPQNNHLCYQNRNIYPNNVGKWQRFFPGCQDSFSSWFHLLSSHAYEVEPAGYSSATNPDLRGEFVAVNMWYYPSFRLHQKYVCHLNNLFWLFCRLAKAESR